MKELGALLLCILIGFPLIIKGCGEVTKASMENQWGKSYCAVLVDGKEVYKGVSTGVQVGPFSRFEKKTWVRIGELRTNCFQGCYFETWKEYVSEDVKVFPGN